MLPSPIRKHLAPLRPRPPPQAHKIRLSALLPRRIGFDAVNLLKQLLQPHLKRVIFRTLVEFTQEVPAGDEGVEGEGEGRVAEVLYVYTISVQTAMR